MKTYMTKDYKMFRCLNGNRTVTENRVKKVVKSIQKHGWIHNPIIVNSKYEVIDGQARLEACKQLGIEVEYIIDPDRKLEECQALNAYQTVWSTYDYIDSYVSEGKEDYSYLNALIKKYAKGQVRIGLSAITCAINDSSAFSNRQVKDGTFQCTKEQYERASECLDYLVPLMPYVSMVDGRTDYLQCAIVFIRKHESDVDFARFSKIIESSFGKIPPVATIDSVLRDLENLYNRRNRSKLVNFENDHKALMREQKRHDAVKAREEHRKRMGGRR